MEIASSLVMPITLSTSFRSRLPGMKPAPIPLNFVRTRRALPPPAPGRSPGIGRFNGDGDQIFYLWCFDIAADAGQRSAGTYAGDKHIHLTIGIFPDFRAGSLLVEFRVSRVAELLQQQELFRVAGDNLFRFRIAPFMPLAPSVSTRFSAQGFQQPRRSMLMVSGMVSVSL